MRRVSRGWCRSSASSVDDGRETGEMQLGVRTVGRWGTALADWRRLCARRPAQGTFCGRLVPARFAASRSIAEHVRVFALPCDPERSGPRGAGGESERSSGPGCAAAAAAAATRRRLRLRLRLRRRRGGCGDGCSYGQLQLRRQLRLRRQPRVIVECSDCLDCGHARSVRGRDRDVTHEFRDGAVGQPIRIIVVSHRMGWSSASSSTTDRETER